MGEKEPLPEWLPAGWSMEVRLKKDGRTYKCYTDPSGDLKFYSKPEVLRHLKNVRIKCYASKETKRKSTKKSAKKQYVVKKVAAEGLPPGWVEEIRVRKSGGSEKRADKYFIDPASGRVFRSMKEVLRHLETEDVDKSTLESKDKGNLNIEPSNDTSPLQAEGENRVLRSKASKQVLKDRALKSVAEGKGVKVTKIKAIKEVDKNQDMKAGAEGEEDRGPKSKTNEEVIKDQALKTAGEGDAFQVPKSKTNEGVDQDQGLKSVAEGQGVKVPMTKTNEKMVKDLALKPDAEGKGFKVPKSKTNEDVVKDQTLKSVAEGDKDKSAESKEKKEVDEDQEMKAASEGVGDRVPDREGAGGERDRVPKSKISEEVKDQATKSGLKGRRKSNRTSQADEPLAKRKKETDVSRGMTDLASMEMDIEENVPPVGELGKNGNRKVHHKNKKLNGESCAAMPRRTSKRLAGVKVDQLLELETNTRARQVVGKQLSETDNDTNKHQNDLNISDKHIREAQIPSASDNHIREAQIPSAGKHQGRVLLPAGYLNRSDKHIRETNTRARRVVGKQSSETDNDINKHQKDLNSSDKHIREAQIPGASNKHISEAKIPCAGKHQGSIFLPAGYLNCSDKHIRGAQFPNASGGKRQGPVLLPAGYLPFSQDHVGALGTVRKRDEDAEVSLDSFCKDFFNDPSIDFAIKTLTDAIPIGDDTAQNPGCTLSNPNPASTPALPCGDLWTDPCFAFAVKTLTGDIPLQEDSCMNTSFQQPLSSSEAPRPNGLSLTTGMSDSFRQVNHHSFTHFSATEIPWYRQQDLATPAASRVHNANPEVRLSSRNASL